MSQRRSVISAILLIAVAAGGAYYYFYSRRYVYRFTEAQLQEALSQPGGPRAIHFACLCRHLKGARYVLCRSCDLHAEYISRKGGRRPPGVEVGDC
jgi:hypothetical protein